MVPSERELHAQAAALNARLTDTAAEVQYLAGELHHLSRPRREFSRAQLAMTCRRMLTLAEDLSRVKDRIEAIQDGTDLDPGTTITQKAG